MPPWNDVTLHDMAVRSMLRGGVHYRDVFDTNLPGIDWAMAGVRLAFGWSYEVLRAVDLVVIALAVVLAARVGAPGRRERGVDRVARRGGRDVLPVHLRVQPRPARPVDAPARLSWPRECASASGGSGG